MSGDIEQVINASINGSVNGTDVDEYAADVTGLPAEVLVAAVFLGLAAAVGTLNNLLVIIAFLSSFKVHLHRQEPDLLQDHLHSPQHHHRMAVATWAVGSLMILPPLVGWSSFGWNTDCEIENVNPETYGYVSFCLIFVLVSLAITGFVYQRIYSHVKASGERSNPNVPRKVIARRTIQKTKNLFIICCVFCVLWLPGALVFLIDYNASFTPKTVHFVLWILYNSNQAINPVLYAFKIKDFRTTILRPFSEMKTTFATAVVLLTVLVMATAVPVPGLEKRGLRNLWRVRGGVNQMIRYRLYLLKVVKVPRASPRRKGKRSDEDEESLLAWGLPLDVDYSGQLPESLS
uniref:G-protein coupled receptors family 1 profile domain-containing protein n=1 Tax=Branchiostoma floridae TaxID=7739 RepID=C3YFL6_BRAFL|eukprot:XP_002604969.1 hypothetical protein BRAFLDRAFT_92611 [Branchiostoma floridae]